MTNFLVLRIDLHSHSKTTKKDLPKIIIDINNNMPVLRKQTVDQTLGLVLSDREEYH